MSCTQLQDEFVPYLLGEVEPDVARAIEAHLSQNCQNCRDDFQALCDGLDQLYCSVPAASLSVEQQRKIARLAMRSAPPTATVNRLSLPTSMEPQSTFEGALTPARLLQGLLAVAAGFFLVIGWQALRVKSESAGQPKPSVAVVPRTSQGATEALSGDPRLLPDAHDTVHFVTLKVPPTQPALLGYFLADLFSGELHILGNIARVPQHLEQFTLTVITDQTSVEVPITVDANGRFKVIVPLPQSVVRDVVLNTARINR